MTTILKALGVYQPSLPFSQKPVEIQDIETAAEKRPRTLKHLIKTPNRLSYNLGCAFFFGAPWERLNEIYEAEELKLSNTQNQWKDSPSEVSLEDWMYFLGKSEYQRAYVDFFEDQLVQFAYDWKALVQFYLHKAEPPLIRNLMGYEGDALIQMAFALEVSSKTLAIESLARACCEYNPVFLECCNHKRNASQTQGKESFQKILESISKDEELSNSYESVDDVLDQQGSRLSAYVQRWNINTGSLDSEFVNAQLKAAAFATEPKPNATFDNVLKSAYALRTLLPLQHDAESQICLVRQWSLLLLATYVFAGMPDAGEGGEEVSIPDITWRDVQERAVDKSGSLDSIGVVRTFKTFAETWPMYDDYYLKAASRYVSRQTHKG